MLVKIKRISFCSLVTIKSLCKYEMLRVLYYLLNDEMLTRSIFSKKNFISISSAIAKQEAIGVPNKKEAASDF